MAQVSRDPFSRTELHRRNVFSNGVCSWCGQWRTTKAGNRYLYAYSTEADGGRKSQHNGFFCSKSCHDSYHS